jgi:hypothetical protein
MSRTSRRPVPSGRVTPDEALGFGLVLFALSVMTLGVLVGRPGEGRAFEAIPDGKPLHTFLELLYRHHFSTAIAIAFVQSTRSRTETRSFG